MVGTHQMETKGQVFEALEREVWEKFSDQIGCKKCLAKMSSNGKGGNPNSLGFRRVQLICTNPKCNTKTGLHIALSNSGLKKEAAELTAAFKAITMLDENEEEKPAEIQDNAPGISDSDSERDCLEEETQVGYKRGAEMGETPLLKTKTKATPARRASGGSMDEILTMKQMIAQQGRDIKNLVKQITEVKEEYSNTIKEMKEDHEKKVKDLMKIIEGLKTGKQKGGQNSSCDNNQEKTQQVGKQREEQQPTFADKVKTPTTTQGEESWKEVGKGKKKKKDVKEKNEEEEKIKALKKCLTLYKEPAKIVRSYIGGITIRRS